MNLPPFSQTFYSSYHSPTHSSSSQVPHNMPYVPMGAPSQPYHYPVTSPVINTPGLGSHRAPPHYSESPRIPGGYSSSPGVRHLSPTSPTTHLAPPGMTASTASTSSSSYPSVTRTPAVLPKKRRSTSSSQDESWDDKMDRDEEQPWGMPQDEYKALNPRDKKQVRNRWVRVVTVLTTGSEQGGSERRERVSQTMDSAEGRLRQQSRVEPAREGGGVHVAALTARGPQERDQRSPTQARSADSSRHERAGTRGPQRRVGSQGRP
jgi:hypothetical protein